jgi:hypothetical protein
LPSVAPEARVSPVSPRARRRGERYPEPEKGGRGRKGKASETNEFSQVRLREARAVLRPFAGAGTAAMLRRGQFTAAATGAKLPEARTSQPRHHWSQATSAWCVDEIRRVAAPDRYCGVSKTPQSAAGGARQCAPLRPSLKKPGNLSGCQLCFSG